MRKKCGKRYSWCLSPHRYIYNTKVFHEIESYDNEQWCCLIWKGLLLVRFVQYKRKRVEFGIQKTKNRTTELELHLERVWLIVSGFRHMKTTFSQCDAIMFSVESNKILNYYMWDVIPIRKMMLHFNEITTLHYKSIKLVCCASCMDQSIWNIPT